MNQELPKASDQINLTTEPHECESCWQRPVDGGLQQQLVLQHGSSHKLVADAVLEAAENLRPAAVGVQDLKHLQLPVPVHKELRHLAVQTHQNAAGLLERRHEAAHQLVGDALCEPLERRSQGKFPIKMIRAKCKQKVWRYDQHFIYFF